MLRQVRNTVLKATASSVAVVSALEVTTHIPSEGRSCQLYHSFVDNVVTPSLRRLLSPEQAHNVAIECSKYGLAPKFRRISSSSPPSRHVDLSVVPFRSTMTEVKQGEEGEQERKKHPLQPLTFPNPVGLAAGFDKDGVAIKGLLEMGFGFVEIGSVTPLPQPGNPKPRMFRLVEDKGIINRYGFNSVGMNAVKENLINFRQSSKADTSPSGTTTKHWRELNGPWEKSWYIVKGSIQTTYTVIHFMWQSVFGIGYTVTSEDAIVGLNVGKNKTSQNEIEDYVQVIRTLGPYADYIVVNISSPNTPGLRDLQQQDPLRNLLQNVIEQRNQIPSRFCEKRHGILKGKDIPLLVKIAPDLTHDEMKDIAFVVQDVGGIDGLVVCNTTISRPDSLISLKHKHEVGGLSGAPVKDISTNCIRTMYQLTNGTIPIIGVGGISSGEDVYEKLKAGASLIQIYSALAYEGPGLVSRVQSEIEQLMIQNGDKCIDDIVGLDHEDIYWKRKQQQLKQQHGVA